MKDEYYIVECEHRGCFIGYTKEGGKPRCSYSILRSDPKVIKFHDIESARVVRDKIPKAYILHFSMSYPIGQRMQKVT